jgi:Winged helix DNA-binding domain
VRLLGGFDNYLLGYRDRDPIISAEHRSEVYVGGVIRPTILHDGRVIGRWRLVRPTRKDRPAIVEVGYFGRPSIPVRAAVDAEVTDIGRFLGLVTEPGQLRR